MTGKKEIFLKKVKYKIVRHSLFKKFMAFLILLFIFMVLGYRQYRQAIYLPEEANAFKLESYALGREGDKPFYQTDDDFSLSEEISGLNKSKALYFFSKKYYELYNRHYSKGKILTQMIKVGENQLPGIYNMVKDACDLLGVEKVPGIYLTGSNGTAIKVTNRLNPTIYISSDFTWAFKPEELRFLLAREVAHIKLGHIYYLDLIGGMRSIANMALPKFLSKIIIGSVGIKLMQWYKEAEISADRGALVVTGDVDVALRALVKLNIGANIEDNYPNLNIDAYINQLSELKDDRMESASAVMHELENINPFITIRCRHLSLWYKKNDLIFK